MPRKKKASKTPQEEQLCREFTSDELMEDISPTKKKKTYIVSYITESEPKIQKLLRMRASNEDLAWKEALKKLTKENNTKIYIKKYIACID